MRLFLCIVALLFSSLSQAQPVTAKSWLVADSLGQIVQGENVDDLRPIASISKLFTAMIVLDARQDLEEKIEYRKKLSVTRRQLLEMSLVHSDNHASQLLCDNYPGRAEACVRALNNKAQALGMVKTALFEPTGLDARNVSTAKELILLVRAARTYGVIIDASKMSRVDIQIKRKWLFFKNTNPMIGKNPHVLVSKTGFINASGGCIVLLLDSELGDRVVVVLGSKNTRTRIPEAEFISNIKE
jgi:D-alanyl-D-alanine endopeptidase (penicillin-binding protein 7)